MQLFNDVVPWKSPEPSCCKLSTVFGRSKTLTDLSFISSDHNAPIHPRSQTDETPQSKEKAMLGVVHRITSSLPLVPTSQLLLDELNYSHSDDASGEPSSCLDPIEMPWKAAYCWKQHFYCWINRFFFFAS